MNTLISFFVALMIAGGAFATTDFDPEGAVSFAAGTAYKARQAKDLAEDYIDQDGRSFDLAKSVRLLRSLNYESLAMVEILETDGSEEAARQQLEVVKEVYYQFDAVKRKLSRTYRRDREFRAVFGAIRPKFFGLHKAITGDYGR